MTLYISLVSSHQENDTNLLIPLRKLYLKEKPTKSPYKCNCSMPRLCFPLNLCYFSHPHHLLLNLLLSAHHMAFSFSPEILLIFQEFHGALFVEKPLRFGLIDGNESKSRPVNWARHRCTGKQEGQVRRDISCGGCN